MTTALASLRAAALHPKNLITFLITLVLVVGEWSYGVIGGYEKLALTLGVCVACEVALSLLLLGHWPAPQSAYITGISLTILVRPQAGLWWPFIVGPLLAITSKYVLRYRGRHLWNPSNFALAVLLILAPHRVAILSHEFGNEVAGNAVIWVFGLLIAWRARILHVSATYVLCFVSFAVVRSLVTGAPLLAEIGPLTGPMYQLMVFFMLTDPRTSVSTKQGRMITVAIVAVVEAFIRLANDFDVPGAVLLAPAPPILALSVVGPLAMAIDLRRTAARKAAAAVPHQTPQPAVTPIVEPALIEAGDRNLSTSTSSPTPAP